ncbi:MAG: methyl-accepting chemotaxis protein [Gammaproteobacteria bacterium]|nr:methyl-accepting chemotaxis protein [Gammaproteobacteria bacterium]MBU0853252.1 methyl-accepting chemotaxis protein [Gammaproteobacteria bacterium]MBU1459963.1 methyl-accepting chemotaxis protein [Gammaproteobacteria bacterium]MBU1772887.1 methyl-accepting chemotaxis protein [Gammaproteobacteria bacterium]|tara:strand:- start:10899 stop:12812 length:1914 start_codon:yes stop_codon:yes gene_type:complete
MFANIRIGQRIAISFVLLLTITVATLVALFFTRFESLLVDSERRELRGVYDDVSNAIASESLAAERLSALVASIPDVQKAMAENDRDRLSDLFVTNYKTLASQYGLDQFQFHKAPATSFLRVHKPEKFGDDLTAIRNTIIETNTRRTPVRGVESGVAGLGIRGLVPINHNGSPVGSVEFGLSFGQAFFDTFKARQGVDVGLLLRKEYGGFEPFATTFDSKGLISKSQLEQAFSGQDVVFRAQADGKPVAVLVSVVNDFSGKPIGVLEVAMDRTRYADALADIRNTALIIAGVAIALGLLIAALLARSIVRPIRVAAEAMHDIAAGEGDLTRRLEANGRNEVADLARAFNQFADKVRRLVSEVAGSTAQVAASAEEMSAITDGFNRDVSRQRDEIEQVATAMNEMTATVQDVARNAAQAAESAKSADLEAQQGQLVVHQTVSSIEGVSAEVARTASAIQRLETDSQSISKVLEVIRGVAEQTNLLALNAAIEAARAGEQGRGFAVVADEVRTLASRTQQSTIEIQQVIEQLQSGARDAADVMNQGREQVDNSVMQAQQAGTSLLRITNAVTSISDMNVQIASAAEQQSAVSDEISKNVVNINHIADRVTESAGQTAQASSQLAHLASDLQTLVGQFKY